MDKNELLELENKELDAAAFSGVKTQPEQTYEKVPIYLFNYLISKV